MRGLAVSLVLIHHISSMFQYNSVISKVFRNVLYGGWTGVDLFFVLSGFLITGILWDTRHAEHYFRNFYARRTLRIFPLYYATLILVLCIIPLASLIVVKMPATFQGILNGSYAAQPYWPLFCTYLVNVLVAWKGFGSISLTHFWTLSVEEHFYLLWPFVVCRLTLRKLIITSIMLVVGALILRMIAIPLINPIAILVLTPFRMDGLALGALLALLWRMPEQKVKIVRWARVILPVTGLILFTLFCYKGTASSIGHLSQSIGYTASILFYGCLLVRVLDTAWLNSIFRHRVPRFFGKYSYSVYVFHPFPQLLAAPFFALGSPSHPSMVVHVLKTFFVSQTLPLSGPLLWLDGFVYVLFVPAASVVIAMLTWRLLEAPCLRLKSFFTYEEKDRLVEGSTIVTELIGGSHLGEK